MTVWQLEISTWPGCHYDDNNDALSALVSFLHSATDKSIASFYLLHQRFNMGAIFTTVLNIVHSLGAFSQHSVSGGN